MVSVKANLAYTDSLKIRQEAEDLIQADLSGARIHNNLISRALCQNFGVEAISVGQNIFLGQIPANDIKRVLFHELIHFRQKQLGQSTCVHGSLNEVELEANAAADALSLGRDFRCRTPDIAHIPRAWDQAGHFSTVSLAFENCQSDNSASLAKFCWLPDAVEEFAATETALDELGKYLLNERLFSMILSPREVWNKHYTPVEAIQKGLHCLTGASRERELSARSMILNQLIEARAPQMDIGLALHAFGDVFSHAKLFEPTTMYSAGIGHLLDWHDPDKTFAWGRTKPYREYFRLLTIFASKFSGKKPLVDPEIILLAAAPILNPGEVYLVDMDRYVDGLKKDNPNQVDMINKADAMRKGYSAMASCDTEKTCCEHLKKSVLIY